MPLQQPRPVGDGGGMDGSEERGAPVAFDVLPRQLAEAHALRLGDARSSRAQRRTFMEALQAQETLLQRAHEQFTRASIEEPVLSYAAEWFLDNYYLLQRVRAQIEEDFSASYYEELPKLSGAGPLQGYPRVFDIARHLVAQGNCEVSEQRILHFLEEYQEISPLRIGELWALPVMLRVVLLAYVIAGAGVGGAFPISKLEFRISSLEGLNGDDVIATCIPSLRTLGYLDWKTFIERVSYVDRTLQQDPAQVYGRMDFETRDRYRKCVEELALRTGRKEVEVARAAVALAAGWEWDGDHADVPEFSDLSQRSSGDLQAPPGSEPENVGRERHVGTYLVDRGREALETALGYEPGAYARVGAWLRAHPTPVYLSSISAVALLFLLAVVWYFRVGVANYEVWELALTLALLVVPAVTVATSVVNWLVTQIVSPRVLPKLDFSEGIAPQHRAFVVIPSMLSDEEEVASLLQQLEGHFLRNPDPNLSFALLTDFTDSAEEETPDDVALLEAARRGIEALNDNYRGAPFYLFHRRRVWNEREGVWMGWERKRGKLHEFNRLLRGAQDTSFVAQAGDVSRLQQGPPVRYVITLDTDTILPRDGAATLAGAMAHSLNRALFDERTEKVIAGYTILQPRTEIQPDWGRQSLFTRVFAGDSGLDLYSRAVSNVYHDLFGEGIYVGKGIYDVDAFERSLAGRVPENSLLSHDLFEGIHGRAGLISDVIFYEDYPPHYLLQVRRTHRWVRGDWQLLPWLLPWAPTTRGWARNRLALIDLWKIGDNLRRSLLAPLLLLLLIAGWTILPGSPLVWTLVAVLTPALALMTGVISALIGGSREAITRQLRDSAVRWMLYVAFLPYEATLNLDAIVTTLVRLTVTRRNLLQWTTASRTTRLFGDEVSAELAWQNMLSPLVVSAALGVALFVINPQSLPVAFPLLLLWALSPELAYLISRPEKPRVAPLTDADRAQLRRLARRTWFFFERFVGPDDNWLPPDHFQEDPKGVVAHRTSPTNIGLYLLSAIAAHDMGYVDPMALMLRLRSAFDSMQQMERYRGHYLNWMDTSTLTPLPPRYVSTVDSGNLAASLIALQQALQELPQAPVLRGERWQGFLDTLDVFVEALAEVAARDEAAAFRTYLEQLRAQVEGLQARAWTRLLEEAADVWLPEMERRLIAVVERARGAIGPDRLQDLRLFVERAADHLQNMKREQELLWPWLRSLAEPPALFAEKTLAPEVKEAWEALQETFGLAEWDVDSVTLRELSSVATAGQRALAGLQAAVQKQFGESTLAGSTGDGQRVQAAREWIEALDERLASARWMAQSIVSGCVEMRQRAETIVQEMDFTFLFHARRQVFHIGYNVDAGRLDDNYYDLLASEARMASLVAIAKNDAPFSHWLHLARPVTSVQGRRTLLSWSGTMFEYLMPPLLLRSYSGTLLNSSARQAIVRQMAYAAENSVPWGISESGFYTFDGARNYQYRAFGVPGLGFKRGLGEDLVVSPYASLLALPFEPQQALKNMDALAALGMKGRYGFYEAVDFTAARLPVGQEAAIVHSYMAHHQGMILVALLNYLQQERMVRRFHANARVQSVELLLQEQVPYGAPLEKPEPEQAERVAPERARVPTDPWRVPTQTAAPAVHVLSNGRYQVMISNAGGGYSQWKELALTRWRPDMTLDCWGQWLYIEEMDGGARDLWSAAVQPLGATEDMQVSFHPHKVQWRRRRRGITLQAEVFVAPDDDVEIRRFRLNNDSDRTRRLRLTSYAEIALAEQGADERHQAFSKLFVESEYLGRKTADEERSSLHALLFGRRTRGGDDEQVFLGQMAVLARHSGPQTADAGGERRAYETDRLRFLGRNGSARRPQALADGAWLSGTTGATLDPVAVLSQTVVLAPYSMVELAVVTTAGRSRAEIVSVLERYRSWSVLNRAAELSRSRAEHEMQRLELGSPLLQMGQRLLSLLMYPHPALRATAGDLAANRKGQPGLWAYGISGDYPILLLRLRDEAESALLQDVLRIHGYWAARGLKIDLVVLNEQASNYGQMLQGFVFRSVRRMGAADRLQQRGGIFVLSRDQIDEEAYYLLQAAARVCLDGSAGDLQTQGERGLLAVVYEAPTRLPRLEASVGVEEIGDWGSESGDRGVENEDVEGLLFDNGFGGFTPDGDGEPAGKEYVVRLQPGEATPAPWINVIANPEFGFLVSESGGGFTWAENSGENRLTTWRNDPVTDAPAEAIYLRDEETAAVWSPTPQPAPGPGPYVVRHGTGYTVFEHESHGLRQEVKLFAAIDAPVKIVRVRLENTTVRQRRLTVTYYAEWVLGSARSMTQQYLIPEYVGDCHALLVRNPYNVEFAERVAFLATSREPHGLTANRTEFLGRLGSLARPAALARIGLENAVNAGLDPCGAMQMHMDLAEGEAETVYFLLGQGQSRADALALIGRYVGGDERTTDEGRRTAGGGPQTGARFAHVVKRAGAAAVEAAWREVQTHWERVLGKVQVRTPDAAMDLMLNRWLLYQALSCRIWGRSALYQSSGAFGFRDQLQDVMALVHSCPRLAREHILRAARHQFEDGDVLHWWHPPSGRGVRTRISDDLLWLPHVTAHYVSATGDVDILEEEAPFLRGKLLAEGEEERYGHYAATAESYALFEHCVRALYKGMTLGRHGLPLIGGGDWNDGMNRVGIEGRGESVWLGWFLVDTLQRFAALCEQVDREAYAASFRERAEAYRQALEDAGWDGQWYRRAYYDDGAPLGSQESQECQIDAIAQSWSVLSGAGARERQRQAMAAIDEHLIDRERRLLYLFRPPFDKTEKDPGYIKGYPPGIRENGGQYTHAAIWTAWAFAELEKRAGAGYEGDAEALFRLLNPVYHASTREQAQVYRVEPYVIAADVYGVAPHSGRGGWTWYTGSSGWMYRLGLEAVLGVQREGDRLRIKPAIPSRWPGYQLTYRFGEATYHIDVMNAGEQAPAPQAPVVTLDGKRLEDGWIPLEDDGRDHYVRVKLAAV